MLPFGVCNRVGLCEEESGMSDDAETVSSSGPAQGGHDTSYPKPAVLLSSFEGTYF
jgi:hypothetical protein